MNLDKSCQLPNLLTLDVWKQLSKETSCNFYVDLSNRLHHEEIFIEKVLTRIQNKNWCSSLPWRRITQQLWETISNHPQCFRFVSETSQRFKKNDFTTLQENCILVSSIIANLYDDASIQLDVSVHAYRGSSTLEKLKIVDNYDSKNLKFGFCRMGRMAFQNIPKMIKICLLTIKNWLTHAWKILLPVQRCCVNFLSLGRYLTSDKILKIAVFSDLP